MALPGPLEHAPWRVWSVSDAELDCDVAAVYGSRRPSRTGRSGSATFVQVADWLHAYVVKNHPDEEALRQEWMEADDPWAACAGRPDREEDPIA